MKNSSALVLLGVILLLIFGPTARTQERRAGLEAIVTYEEMFDRFMNLARPPQRAAAVKNLVVQRDVARFELQDGEMILLRPLRTRTSAALFLGKGVVSLTPPTTIEQEQLYRYYETKSLQKKFKRLFLIFADSTLPELESKLNFAAGPIRGDVEGEVSACLEYLSDKRGKYFDTDIMKTFLDDKQNGLFYAHFAEDKGEPMFFRINPDDVEELSVQRRAETSRFYKIPEVVCQFHKQEEYVAPSRVAEDKHFIEINRYKIESTIANNLTFSASAEVEFKPLVAEQRWIYFSLFSDMEVDSAFWQSGEKAVFFKEKDNPVFWLQSEPPLTLNETRTFKIFYHGDLIRRDGDWFYIKAPSSWYPNYGSRKVAYFDMTFHTPKQFSFVSVGHLDSSKEKGEVVTTRWVTPEPIRQTSFNVGFFKKHEVEDKRLPPITVLMSAEGRREMEQVLARQGALSGKNMEKQVGEDVANSMVFFQHVFGQAPVKHFYATEIPYLHGQAFPGLIHLSWTTFYQTDREGYDEIFRAHEVAHQWWGIGVDFETYHDQWLSEGLSTFAGLWYMQTVLRDNKKYFDRLKEYREAILNNRQYLFGSGQEAGPIWLGSRTSSSTTEGDYDLIIYRKGAWVFHMLRNLLLDLKTMKEDAFTNMLRDFYQSYLGKKASTEDFQRVVEKHAGMNLDWFFKQWVYGTDIPTYHFSYKSEPASQGKYVVHCKIEQLDVPEDFQMIIPLAIDFGQDRFARVRVVAKGPLTRVDLPLMPLKPEKIAFNDIESVLCHVKNVKWEE